MSTRIIHTSAPWWLVDYLKSPIPSNLLWPSKQALANAFELGVEEISDTGYEGDFWRTVSQMEGLMERFLMKVLETIFQHDSRCILLDKYANRYYRLVQFLERYGKTEGFAGAIADYTLKANAEMWDDWMSCPSESFNETILMPLVAVAKSKIEVLFELMVSHLAVSGV